MLNWIKRRRAAAPEWRGSIPATPKPPARAMSGQYLLLYNYLENRYANTVVLTFAQIEDLLGFTLPERARLEQEWWTNTGIDVAGSNHRDSWMLASRTATPNLSAEIVVFDRAS